MVFRAVVFTFIPTFVELVLVCGLLARTFRPLVSVMVIATFVAYVTWTLYMTTVSIFLSLSMTVILSAFSHPPARILAIHHPA